MTCSPSVLQMVLNCSRRLTIDRCHCVSKDGEGDHRASKKLYSEDALNSENLSISFKIKEILSMNTCIGENKGTQNSEYSSQVSDKSIVSSESLKVQLFTASCCSVLFLRLLCPALISPSEWGWVVINTMLFKTIGYLPFKNYRS